MNERVFLSATEIDWVVYAEEHWRLWITLPRPSVTAHVNSFVLKAKIKYSFTLILTKKIS